MSAAAMQPVPLFHEGRRFWEDLVNECRRLTDAVNKAAASDGVCSDQLIRCDAEEDIRILKKGYPSTDVNVRLNFHSWGPVICAAISGEQNSGRKFKRAELEI